MSDARNDPSDQKQLQSQLPNQLPEQELVPEDDAVIGKAMRISLAAIMLITAIIVLIVCLSRDAVVEEVIIKKDAGAIESLDQHVETVPSVTFTDITKQAGITFVHNNGAEGDKLLPESMGSGVAFFDYDSDGDQDILFVDGSNWPESEKSQSASAMTLYQNDGTGKLTDVTEAANLTQIFYGSGVAAADIDNDGDPDLFITALGKNHLYRNDSGIFTDITEESGVTGGASDWSTGATFFDFDNDADLDIFVCNYVQWSRDTDFELNFTLNGKDRAYGPPTHYKGVHPQLLRNNADGTFTDMSESAGIQIANKATNVPVAKSLGVIPIDFDSDDWMDLVVANDTVRNFLFHNKGDGTFEEIGEIAGVAYDSTGRSTGAMGIDAAHYRNDATLAIGIGNFANEMTSFYVTQSDPTFFADESIVEGIGSPSRLFLSFGFFFFDYDLDGRLDILQVNGHLEEEINQIQPSQHYLQTPQLFWNAGPDARSCYVAVPPSETGQLQKPIAGRGSAYADIDGDGDLDVVLTQTGRPAILLRNDQSLGHDWIRIKLIGTQCNRDAIGTRVEVSDGGMTQLQSVTPMKSYLSQSELPLTFGLPKPDDSRTGATENARTIDTLKIHWPDGTTETHQNLAHNQLHTFTQTQ